MSLFSYFLYIQRNFGKKLKENTSNSRKKKSGGMRIADEKSTE
jgi:hypothetical protein